MALVSAKEMIEKAHEGHYAVGAFNINNMEWIKSILAAAEEAKSPVKMCIRDRRKGSAVCLFVWESQV